MMFLRCLLLYILTLTSAFTQSRQQDCQPIDVTDSMPAHIQEHFRTPRDQGDIGWCYAFTTADLLTAEVGVPVSATHVAANYNQAMRRSPTGRIFNFLADAFSPGDLNARGFREGGFVRQTVLRNMEADFVCSEEALPFTTNSEQGIMEHIAFLQDLEQFIESRIGQGPINLNDCHAFSYQRQVNPFIPDDLQMMANQMANYHVDDYLATLAAGACPEHQRLYPREKRVLRRDNPRRQPVRIGDTILEQRREQERREQRWLRQLGGALEAGKPVGLEYDVGPFLLKNDGLSAHASVILARRWVNGQCQYKLRNSWGQSCGSYSNEVANRCNPDEGAFWATSEELLENGMNFNFISNES